MHKWASGELLTCGYLWCKNVGALSGKGAISASSSGSYAVSASTSGTSKGRKWMMLQSSELNGRESKGQINTKKQYGTMSRWTVRHATERFPGPNGLQKPTCAGQTHQQGIGAHRGYRITMKNHENTSRKTMEKPNFWRLFFSIQSLS